MNTTPNRTLNQLLQLVKIDSVTGEESALADFLVDFLKNRVDVVKKDKFGNVYARLDGEGEPIFFSAHMDTVEPGHKISPQIKGAFVVSDGTTILGADNKAALAAILEAFQRAKESLNKSRTIEAIFTRSEESGNYGAINFDYSLLRSKCGYCFDSSDPVGTIILASPFYERFDIEVIGKEAHPSRPQEAINTIPALKSLLNKIRVGQLDPETILNLGVIQTGSGRNTIPGKLVIRGELRSFKEENLLTHKKRLVKILEQLAATQKAQIYFEFVRENPGYKHRLNLSKVQSLLKILKQLSLSPKTKISWGVSDVNIFSGQGLTCFNLGDGTEFTHTTRERIKLTQLQALADLTFGLTRP